MWTDTPDGRKYINDAAKSIVDQVAPEEMEFFEELAAEYYAAPTSGRPATSFDAPLGSGLGEIAVVITPVVIEILRQVTKFLSDEVFKYAKEEGAEKVREVLSNLIGPKKKKKTGPPPLTKEQLEKLKKIAYRTAKAHVSDQTANKIVNAMIVNLVLGD